MITKLNVYASTLYVFYDNNVMRYILLSYVYSLLSCMRIATVSFSCPLVPVAIYCIAVAQETLTKVLQVSQIQPTCPYNNSSSIYVLLFCIKSLQCMVTG